MSFEYMDVEISNRRFAIIFLKNILALYSNYNINIKN